MSEIPIKFMPRAGALRYKDSETGEWICVNPRDVMYSTVTMVATEFWSPETGWKPIYPEEE